MTKSKKKAKIEYPITFDLKVIMISEPGDNPNMVALDNILEDLSIELKKNWTLKKSKSGNYTTYTGKIKVVTQEQMHELYGKLNEHPDVKFAL